MQWKFSKVKDIFYYYKCYKYLILVLYFMTIMSSLVELLPTYFFGKAIDLIVDGDINGILRIVIILCIIFIANISLSFGETYISDYLSNKILNDIKNRLFNSVMSSKLSSINNIRTGTIYESIEDDSSTIAKFVVTDVTDLIVSIARSIIILVLILNISVQLTIISTISIPCYFIVGQIFGKYIEKYSYKLKETSDIYATTLQEYLLHIKEFKILNNLKV